MDWLLRTKLAPPPARTELVRRPRLMRILAEGLRRPLTLISAPAGFGKTTLIAEWRASGDVLPLAWVALDETDSDPTRFWSYVLASLRGLDDQMGDAATKLLVSPQPAPLDAVVSALVSDLAFLTEDIVLALDDFHLIENASIDRSLTYFVEHLPPRFHVVVLSRSEPRLPLSRMRARGLLTEVRAQDLRFTPDEAARFLDGTMGLNLSPHDVQVLEAGTEGWVAGLQLAALSLRGREDAGDVIRSFGPSSGGASHRYVVDYLVEEVLQRQPAGVQAFLTKTAVLDRLCGSLCDHVTESKGGQAMLEQLERQNLFLVPLDEEREWYRYHHLFTGALRFRLRQTDAASLPALHLRAASWYEAKGQAAEAVGHALAGDPERAAELIVRASDELMRTGQMATLQGWIEALPDDVVEARLGLCISHAWTLLVDGKIDRAARRAERADQLIDAAEAFGDVAKARGQVLATRAHVAIVRGHVDHALELGHEALERLPPNETVGRGVTAITLGFAHQLQGDWRAAEQDYARAAEVGEATGNLLIQLSALGCVSELRAVHGELRRSAEICHQIVGLASEGRRQMLPIGSIGLIGLAYNHREWNQLEIAERYARTAIDLAPQTAVQALVVESWLTLALIELARGDPEAASAAAARSIEVASGRQEPRGVAGSKERAKAVTAMIAIARGDLDRAREWAVQSGIGVGTPPHPLMEIEAAVFVRLLLAEAGTNPRTGGAVDDAATIARVWAGASESGGRLFRTVGFLALEAVALDRRGLHGPAQTCLVRALSLGERELMVRSFADLGPPMTVLLGSLLEQLRRGVGLAAPASQDDPDPDAAYTFALAEDTTSGVSLSRAYLETVWRACRGATPDASSTSPRQDLVEPLSDRELEVLMLMANGASNTDIASRLIVGMSTVKTHVNRIFRKLQAESRTQAVARGRALGLIER